MTINLCMSGGAIGADLQFGMCSGKLGYGVVHWSFNGHKTDAPKQEVVILNEELLLKPDNLIYDVSKVLNKSIPKNLFVKNLIRRNYYQVYKSNSFYAVSTIKNGLVEGGTGWAFAMHIILNNKNTYVFEQNLNKWFIYNDYKFEHIESPPLPTGIFAGVGTRDLNINGKNAIRKLLKYN